MFDVVQKEILSRDISKCQTRELANLMWALGKIEEKEHKLVEICEKEILSRGIVAFNNADIFQIVNGCANLIMRTSRIFGNIQEAILNGQLKLEDFEDRGLWGMLVSFCKTENGSAEMFDVVLNEIFSRDISKFQPQYLANLMWALGKIEEKEHEVVDVCEKEILLRGIMAFDNAHICQIVNGCANLNLRTSRIFGSLQEAILNGQLKIEDFDDRGLCEVLLSFFKTENGSLGMFDVVLREILSRDMSRIDIRGLAQFVWTFAMMEFRADELFDRIEAEILKSEETDFHNDHLIQILWAYATGEKGSEELFHVLDNELVSRGVKSFNNFELSRIVWSFAKRQVRKAKAFDLVKKEIFDRGLCKFSAHELVLILWSFVSAEKHDDILLSEIDGELCFRDLKQLSNANLCQVVWSVGRVGWLDSKLFDVIEAEVVQRGPSEFSSKQKRTLMRGFLEAKRGSKDFFTLLLNSFSATDFSNLTHATICEFSWCLSKARVEAGTLFDALEYEILSKDKSYFNKRMLAYIKLNFKEVGKGSKALFELEVK